MLQQTIYELVPWVLSFATIGALILAWYASRRRQQPGAGWLALTLLAAALWTAFDLFDYVVDLPDAEIAAKRATWALILLGGFAFFRFSCIHARRERWWELARIPVTAAMILNLLVMLTNARHHLLWPGERWIDLGFARVPWLESGPAFFWIFRPTACALPLAGVLALVVSTVESPSFYLRQVAVLAVGVLIPVVVNVIFVSTAAPALDITPVAVVVVVAAFAWSTLRFGLLDVVPMAWSLLLEQLDDGVIVLDTEQRVVDLNPTAKRLLECERWAPGTPVHEIVPFWDGVRGAVESGDPHVTEASLGGAAGTIVEISASPIRGDEDVPLGRFIVLHDVTARARLVRELDAYAETVAHDLKSPLATLTQSVEGMCHGDVPLKADTGRYLDSVVRVCRQMTGTVDALLSFAQLRSLGEVQVEPLDMARIVESTQRRLSATIATAKADITLPDRWPAALGHPVWVEEIWTNYISNAIKYGGRPPHVELGASHDGDRMGRYWVRDNGPGLSAEQRARLFTEFTRLEPQRAEGHGLGLSIVQRIAEKLGGRVGCDSGPGQGSTFWFTLPVP